MPNTTIHLKTHEAPFLVVVEPWALSESEVRPGERCAVVVEHPSIEPTVTCSVIDGQMYITVHEPGSTFKFVRDGIVEIDIPPHLAIPRLSGVIAEKQNHCQQ